MDIQKYFAEFFRVSAAYLMGYACAERVESTDKQD